MDPSGRPADAREKTRTLGPPAGEIGLITRDVVAKTGAVTGVLAVFDQAERSAQLLSAWGAAPGVDHLPSLPADGFVGRVLESGHAAVEPIDPCHDSGLGIPPAGARVTYAAGAAVRPPGGPPGALCVGFSSRPGDPALALWMVERYAGLAALCLHDVGTLDGLLASARFDGSTGSLKHTRIRAELQREIGRSERNGRPLSCCLVQLKGVNEVHGCARVNRALAEVLRERVRVGDTLGRYGGDKFLAILPDTEQSAGYELAERLRSMILSTTPGVAGDPLDVSVGVAQWRPRQTADEMLVAADQALLTARTTGDGVAVSADDAAAGAGCSIAVGANDAVVPGTFSRARSLEATPAGLSKDGITLALAAGPGC